MSPVPFLPSSADCRPARARARRSMARRGLSPEEATQWIEAAKAEYEGKSAVLQRLPLAAGVRNTLAAPAMWFQAGATWSVEQIMPTVEDFANSAVQATFSELYLHAATCDEGEIFLALFAKLDSNMVSRGETEKNERPRRADE